MEGPAGELEDSVFALNPTAVTPSDPVYAITSMYCPADMVRRYGTEISDARFVFAGTANAPLVESTCTPFTVIHVRTSASVPPEFPNWMDVISS